MTLASLRVEIAFSDDPDATNLSWVDVTADVLGDVEFSTGRGDEFTGPEPGRLSMTLDNSSGRYSWGNTSSPYWPGVLPGRRVRVWVWASAADGYDQGDYDAPVSYDGFSGTPQPRFDGHVDGWPVSWDGGIVEQARVQVTASDRLIRLTGLRPLRHPLVEELGGGISGVPAVWGGFKWDDGSKWASGINYLFPLQEAEPTEVAGDSSAVPELPTLGKSSNTRTSAAVIEFGQSGILPEGTMVRFMGDPDKGTQPSLLGSEEKFLARVTGQWAVFFAFAADPPPDSGVYKRAFRVGLYGTQIQFHYADIGARAILQGHDRDTPTASQAVTLDETNVTVADGLAHWVTIWSDGTDLHMRVDDRPEVSDTIPTTTIGGQTYLDYSDSYFRGIGLGPGADDRAIYLAWVGFATGQRRQTNAFNVEWISTAPIVDHDLLAGLTLGWPERADHRIRRVLHWAGFTDDEISIPDVSATIGAQQVEGRAALDVLAEILTTVGDDLVLHHDGQRVRVVSTTWASGGPFAPRVRRAPVAAITGDEVASDITITVDMATLLNDITVSRPGGATFRVTDRASIKSHGLRTGNPTTLPAGSDADLLTAAQLHVSANSTPQPRVAELRLDLTTLPDARTAALHGLLPGDLVTLQSMPGQVPGVSLGSLDLAVQGVTHRVGADGSWQMTLATSPAGFRDHTRWDRFQWDDDSTWM